MPSDPTTTPENDRHELYQWLDDESRAALDRGEAVGEEALQAAADLRRAEHEDNVRHLPVKAQDGPTLTVRDDQSWWTPRQRAALNSIGHEKTPDGDLVAFLHLAQATGLDPFRRELYLIGRKDRDAPGGVRFTAQTGIDGYRTIAERTNLYGGVLETLWCGPDGAWTDVWLSDDPPTAARVIVARTDRAAPEVATALYREFVPMVAEWKNQQKVGEKPTAMWAKMPAHMLAKCLSADTEVLTDHGFRRFDSVGDGERVLMVTDHGLEATDARPFVQDYAGPMVRWDTRSGLDLAMSPNHDVILAGGERVEAGDLLARLTARSTDRIPVAVVATAPDAPVKDDALRLAGYYLADGSDNGPSGFRIDVSRPRKVDVLDELAMHRSVGVRPVAGDTARSTGRDIVTRADKRTYSYARQALDGTPAGHGKHVDVGAALTLSPRQARVLIDAWADFDGDTTHPRGVRRVSMARSDHADAFEVLAVHSGYALTARHQRTSDIGSVWDLTLSTKTEVRVRPDMPTQPGLRMGEPTPEGTVWCVTVPSHTIVVRRRGLTMVTGQCAEALAIRKAFPRQTAGIYTEDEMGQADAAVRNQEMEDAARAHREQLRALAGGIRREPQDPLSPAHTGDGRDPVEGEVVDAEPVEEVLDRDALWAELHEQARVLATTVPAMTRRWVVREKRNIEQATDAELAEIVRARRAEVAGKVVEGVAESTVVPDEPAAPAEGATDEAAPTEHGAAPTVGEQEQVGTTRPPGRKRSQKAAQGPAPTLLDEAGTTHKYVGEGDGCSVPGCGEPMDADVHGGRE